MDSGLSASDVALMNGNDGWGNGSMMWIFALLILAWGGFGNGFGGNNATTAATSNDIQRAVDLNAIQQGQADISADIQRGIYEINGTVKDASYNNLSESKDIEAAIATGFANQQTCCCETKQAIMENRYLDAQNTSAIQATIAASDANTTAQVQKVLDAIATNRMADMQNQITNLQLQNAMAGVVRYPDGWTYNAGTSPFCSCGCSSNI